MKRKFLRDAKGRFRKRWKIPTVIQRVINLLTCSYWAKIGQKTYHLRTFDYNTDLLKVFKSLKKRNEENDKVV